MRQLSNDILYMQGSVPSGTTLLFGCSCDIHVNDVISQNPCLYSINEVITTGVTVYVSQLGQVVCLHDST